jgi:hypothetical protein
MRYYCLLFLTILFHQMAIAQRQSLYVQGGPLYNWPSSSLSSPVSGAGTDGLYNPAWGFSGGVYWRLAHKTRLGWRAGLSVCNLPYEQEFLKLRIDQTYLTLSGAPVLMIKPRFHIHLGPALGYNLQQKNSFSNDLIFLTNAGFVGYIGALGLGLDIWYTPIPYMRTPFLNDIDRLSRHRSVQLSIYYKIYSK